MKKIVSMVVLIFTLICGFSFVESSHAEEEMRAAWVSTVINIDWPSKGSQGNVTAQKQEYIKLVDRLKSAGMNTVIIQVRPESDAIYKSNINPWSRFLTGVQGKNPGYDPLEFVINETHKRGMKVHAWFNPYRASFYNDLSSTSPNNQLNLHRDWIVNYNNKWYYDPGIPEVRNYIVETVSEVVENYNIDGVHFDDYFYPSPDFDDSKSFKKYGYGSKDAWRFNNVNTLVNDVHNAVKSINPNIDFGISPAGIWRNKYNDVNGSNTSGGESYSSHYADTRYWIKNNLIDYVVPQVYWKIGHPRADYATLIKWWSDQVRGTSVKLYIGQGIYKYGQSEYSGENVAAEIKKQLTLNRKYPEIKGSMFFSSINIMNLNQVYNDLRSFYFPYTLPYQNQLMGSNRAETAIQISKRTWPNGTNTVILMNGYDTLNGAIVSPFAAQNNSPILLKFPNKVSDSTINEIKRLNAKKLIVIGNTNSVSQSDINRVKSKISNIGVERINISDPEKLSADIFERLKKVTNVDTIFIASKNALPDVISVSGKAAALRAPILISSKTKLSSENIKSIDNSTANNVYFIGGRSSLSDSVITQVQQMYTGSLANNRIYGANRIETNTKVIERLYTKPEYKKAYLTRSDALIDAITVSVFAQKTDSPIILVGNYVPSNQNRVLNGKFASLVYKVGGGINLNSYKIIYRLLGK